MEQYEDDEASRARVLGNGQVLAFIAGFWGRRRWMVAGTVVTSLAAIGFETWTPRATQNLINITSGGDRSRPRRSGRPGRCWSASTWALR